MEEHAQEMDHVNNELADLRGNVGTIMELLQVINAKMDTQPTVVSEINTTAAVDPPVVSVENPFPYGLSQSFIHPPIVTSVQQTMPVAQSGQQAMPVIQNVQQTVPLVPEPPKAIPTFTQANVHTRVQPYLNEPVYEILDDNDEGYQPRDRLCEEIKTPLKAFHSKLFKAGLVSVSHIGCTSCKGCDKGCVMVRKDVQRLIDDGFLQVVNQAKEVAAIEPTFNLPESRGRIPVFNLPAPNSVMPVFSIPTPVTPTVDQPKPLIIQKPSPFPFSDPKAVPWKYDVTAIDKESGKAHPQWDHLFLSRIALLALGILPPGMSVEFSPVGSRDSPDIVSSCISQRSPVEVVISYSPLFLSPERGTVAEVPGYSHRNAYFISGPPLVGFVSIRMSLSIAYSLHDVFIHIYIHNSIHFGMRISMFAIHRHPLSLPPSN
ncbi:hypothetical protein KIW84_014368 [Lathyrus oleraceus]|uniref:Uncharacterized protein n=1 Tax=Pisum sativum TaxID=3888 RepID=A0A9D5BMJ7_PEA|nr:hypothetical protein KIW84_014368 [Pisum sativum]